MLVSAVDCVGIGMLLKREEGRGKKLTIYVLVFFIVQEMPVLVKYRILTPTLVY